MMAAGVCFRREPRGWMQDQWSWVFSNFGISEIWERGYQPDEAAIYQNVVSINTASELPHRPLVVLSSREARYIKGEASLVEFVHPDNAIYLFGSTNSNLNDADDLGGRVPDHLVYIPMVELEMYSHSAAYITLYDRLVKRGDFG